MIYNLYTVADKKQVGNKAHNLMLLKRAAYNVPNGFVLSRDFCKLIKKSFSLNLKKQIKDYLKQIDYGGELYPLVVRSSSIYEDSVKQSFAGQFTSITNINNEKELFLAISKVIASEKKISLKSYTNKKLKDTLAVIIQKQIIPKLSGVYFTKNPITNKGFLIEHVKGHLEEMVSGKKNSLKINTTKQLNKTFKKLYLEGKQIEQYFKYPQDIEFAIDNKDRIWFLQTRNITTLKNIKKIIVNKAKNQKDQDNYFYNVSLNYIFMLDLSKIPIDPGCYLYKDKNNMIIYIGKAKNLKKRVTSYFTKEDLDSKTRALVENISSIDFIVTKNELEALLLENNLIKKHKPRYNIIFKDSKEYSYLSLTKEAFPRLFILREKPKDNQIAFGPFTSAEKRDNLLKYINKYFKLRTCKTLPKTPCIRYHIGQCSAPCINKISKEEYLKTIETISSLLKGKTEDVLKSLKDRMKTFSKENNFESALVLRDQINAIDYLSLKQNVEKTKTYNQDLVNYILHKDKAYFVIFNISKGILVNKREYTLDVFEEETILDDFILDKYLEKKESLEIILPSLPEQSTIDYFKKKNKKIKLIVPKTGEKKELLDFAYKNIEIKFLENTFALEELKNALSLKEIPKVIECFDISHLSGKFTVGSMVQFKEGRENKKEYRRFKIKSFEGNNDFLAIEEIVKRRYLRLLKEGKDFPDLIVIDGGKGQLSSAKKAIDSLNLYKKVNLISLAKKEEEIFLEDNLIPLKLSRKSKALKLLQRIRDETHRFAITYNRLLRKKDIRK